MQVRDWQDILKDVTETSSSPGDWHAIGGSRADGLGEELVLGHPKAGVFFLKTFAKNPYDLRGVGSQVARRIDDDLDPLFPDQTSPGRFGIKQGVTSEDEARERAAQLKTVFERQAEEQTPPNKLFEDVMDAIESPAHGPMTFDHARRPTELDELAGTFDEADELLSKELDELIDRSGVEHGIH